MIHDGSDISKEREKDKSIYTYSLKRDEELHNLFYEACIENSYELLELTKLSNGKDKYKYIRNNNSLKNLLVDSYYRFLYLVYVLQLQHQ